MKGERMDAYVFIRRASRDTIGQLKQLHDDSPEEIRAVAILTGRYDAIVMVETDNLGTLEDLVMEKIRRTGAADTETAVALVEPPIRGGSNGEAAPTGPKLPKKGLIASVEALIRIRTQAGKVREVLGELEKLRAVIGLAVVTGDFDVLAEVGTASFDEMRRALLRVNGTQGIASTDSSFANFVAAPEEAYAQTE
jgi:DNA-binding Lrp family transcriptional regulator